MIRDRLDKDCRCSARDILRAGAAGLLHSRLWLALGTIAVGGCVSVEAPDKPIVIELNVNIKQEVIYRLAEDAGNTIQQNPEIF